MLKMRSLDLDIPDVLGVASILENINMELPDTPGFTEKEAGDVISKGFLQ